MGAEGRREGERKGRGETAEGNNQEILKGQIQSINISCKAQTNERQFTYKKVHYNNIKLS